MFEIKDILEEVAEAIAEGLSKVEELLLALESL